MTLCWPLRLSVARDTQPSIYLSTYLPQAFYGEKRMKNKKGVTQASQRRWVEYYQQVLEKRALGEPLVRSLLDRCTPSAAPLQHPARHPLLYTLLARQPISSTFPLHKHLSPLLPARRRTWANPNPNPNPSPHPNPDPNPNPNPNPNP